MTNNKNKLLGGFAVVLLAVFMIVCSNPMSSNFSDSSSLQQNTRSISASDVPSLGLVSTYAVFGGGAGITNEGTATVIIGDMGTTGASTMITGFHNSVFIYTETPLNIGAVNGTIYTNAPQGTPEEFANATAAAADALTAFNSLAALSDGIDPGAGQLGGLTLASGVYKSASGAFLITGSDLTLDAQGNADAVWVFQMASSLTVGTPTSSSNVILVNGAQAKNVYWQVGSAATINGAGGGTMVGTIIASAGMTFSTVGNLTVTTLNGRALGLFAAVTMVNTVINANGVPAVLPPVDPPIGPIVVSGSTAANVVPVVSGGGFINVENNGGLVTVTETGTGTINIVNNGGVLTSTNTGNGVMTINSTATGTVTVTNTGNGRVTVNASGADAIIITHTGDEDFTYPSE